MHHPLSFHAWNGYQFTLTQSHSCQYLPAVRCLLFLLHVLAINEKKHVPEKRIYIPNTASPSSTSDASVTPLFKRTRALHSKSLTIQLDKQILWTCTNASLRCHLSTTNRSSFARAVNESLHGLHCFHGLHRFHCLHGFHRRCLLLNGLLHRLHGGTLYGRTTEGSATRWSPEKLKRQQSDHIIPCLQAIQCTKLGFV